MSLLDDSLVPLLLEQKYRDRLDQLPVTGKRTLQIDFQDLFRVDAEFAQKLIEKPDETLKSLREVVDARLCSLDPAYFTKLKEANHKQNEPSIQVQITGLYESTPLRTLGAEQLSKLVMVDAIVVRATPVRPLLEEAAFKCKSCLSINRLPQTGVVVKTPLTCAAPDCGKRVPFDFIQEESVFSDSQDLRLQERPEDLPAGHLPRTLAVNLVGKESVNLARPGDHIRIVGTLRAFAPPGPIKLRKFSMTLDANSVDILGKEPETAAPSLEEEQQILDLAKDPFIHRNIVKSIAPSIFGYEHLKEAVMYLLFGGVTKNLPDITIRGEINALLIGDPGTAKSQLLQYVAKIAPRGLYTSGRGTTAAGLTAAVVHDKAGGFSLEAGALVLADKGICCVDEIDKMKAEDRVAIHEAMEQHTVSVAKGGIVATLNARTAVLAAANPSLGRYEPCRTFSENIALSVTILSRFDLIFVIRDIPDKAADNKMAHHILDIHRREETPIEPPIKADLLRKYIAYAKTIRPQLSPEALEHLCTFYLSMRAASESEGAPISITARQLESLVRLAEARARIALRPTVTVDDATAAINIMRTSLEQVGLDLTSYKMDIDLIMTGKPKSLRDKMQLVLQEYTDMAKESGTVEKLNLILQLEEKHKIPRADSDRMVSQLLRDGTFFEPNEGRIAKT